MYKIFVDGQEGTTGLKINERLEKHKNIEILKIDSEHRKDPEIKKKYLNEADVAFLCLPEDASREAASLVTGNTCVIDASTAHRTSSGWTYGFPELDKNQRERIKNSKKISVPGCHATGFAALMYPLVKSGIVPADYPVAAYSITGYSGGGKKMISQYETRENRDPALIAPRPYALTLSHKHIPEMQKISGLENPPIFTPMVCDFYKGMGVFVPLHKKLLAKKADAAEIHAFFSEYYAGEPFVKVLPLDTALSAENGYFNIIASNDSNRNDICVLGNKDQIVLISRLDNLGKGASGAAVQCMNIVLGFDEKTGLE